MPGPWQIAIIALIIILLFGRGKIAGLMGEVARGITSFKKGMKEDSQPDAEDSKKEQKQVSDKSETPIVDTTAKEKDKAE